MVAIDCAEKPLRNPSTTSKMLEHMQNKGYYGFILERELDAERQLI